MRPDRPHHTIGAICLAGPEEQRQPSGRRKLVVVYESDEVAFCKSNRLIPGASNILLRLAAIGHFDFRRSKLFDDGSGGFLKVVIQGYASLERVENDLKVQFPGMTRAQHFVALLGGVKPDERYSLLRERLFHLMALPEPQRTQFLTELDLAMARSEVETARRIMEDELKVLIELPLERLQVGLTARMLAHGAIDDEEERLAADTALDYAIGDALGGPQRVLVRDFLESQGWERP